MTFVDTNIFLDILTIDGTWAAWSQNAIERAAANGQLVTNHVVVAELYGRPATSLLVDIILQSLDVSIADLTDEVARRAGQAFGAYRAIGGQREHILADFLIGAHASILRYPLITRDAKRFRRYFPELSLISPETLT